MDFEWDERKRNANFEKHGLDFIDAVRVFSSPYVVAPSSYGSEKRYLATGIFKGRFVTIIYTLRGEAIRIISFRRARHVERKTYQKILGGTA
jgi:uncharacterized DUF497 family protein